MKKYFLIAIAIFFYSCKDKEVPVQKEETVVIDSIKKPQQKKPNLLIIPGETIGNISLEQDSNGLETILGKADLSDAAMGKAWLTWYSKISDSVSGKTELNIYTTYKDKELVSKIVRQIRITSPDFKTADGIATGKNLSEIQNAFADVKSVGKYKNPDTGNDIFVYDDKESGIAFEIENASDVDRCIAIIIHPKDKNVLEEYLYFHPDMTKF